MINVHAIRTGSVRIRPAQRGDEPGGMFRMLTSTTWTEWLPIYAWLIEHPEGNIMVDTGETARTAEDGYFPAWHPYYRRGVEMDVTPGDEVGPQLHAIGVDPASVKQVLLTHLHTDHAGGLHHFPNSRIYVPAGEHEKAGGFAGRLRGYLPNRWPATFSPVGYTMDDGAFGPFASSQRLTRSGDVIVVPTPGHTRDHVSVVVRDGETSFFLAGDATYTEEQLLERRVDGISPDRQEAEDTLDRILAFAVEEPMVYLPSHDPESAVRLQQRQTLLELA